MGSRTAGESSGVNRERGDERVWFHGQRENLRLEDRDLAKTHHYTTASILNINRNLVAERDALVVGREGEGAVKETW